MSCKEESKMKSDKVLDATGLACPMPVVKAKKAMDELSSGQILELNASDKGAVKDIPSWAKTFGHEVVEQTVEDGLFKFWIKKA
jgi:tRNA 2-thiouridine synthesizing protein A